MADMLGPYELGRVHHADCLEAMRLLPDGCVDAVLTDPPYGTTRNHWDQPVHWSAFMDWTWDVLRTDGPIVALTDATTNYVMRAAQLPRRDDFCFDLVWVHNLPTGHLNAKIRPMLAHLWLSVFCRETPRWLPQMTDGPPTHKRRPRSVSSGSTYGKHARTPTAETGKKWPTTVLTFDAVHASVRDHDSEKPVDLAEWMIRSFTEPGDLVCDPFSGGGWMGIAAHRTGRRFVGFDSDQASVDLSNRRIAAERERLGEVKPQDATTGQQIGLLFTGK